MATTTAKKKTPKGIKKSKQPATKAAAAKKVKQATVKKNTLTRKALLMKAQFITDGTGKKVAVVLPLKTFEKVVEDLEELEDIRLYDEGKRSGGKGIPMMEAFRQIEEARRKKV